MTSRPSRFPAAAKRCHSTPIGLRPAAIFIGSLFAAVAFLQQPAHSAEAGRSTEQAVVARSSDSAASIAELEKGFWICDYLGTTRGVDGPHGVTCGANFEEIKQLKFGGDFEKLVAWWRLNKAAQHKALESAGSAQF